MDKIKRQELAYKALLGTAIGDAFGESFFGETDEMLAHIQSGTLPETTWEFTDDTVMAKVIYEQLVELGSIHQDKLAIAFADSHDLDPNRGYGATARRILRGISEGGNWQNLAQEVFEGMGSMGNGAAMRVAPIGAYYFDDLDKVKHLAILSAEVTHANIEGISGAIAVAMATAITTKNNQERGRTSPEAFIQQVADQLPDVDTKSKVLKALSVETHYHIDTIKTMLGNGVNMTAQDTVPFAIWCAAHHQHNFEEALWKAVSILGDRDTICAIVGGITMMSAAGTSIPHLWMEKVEKP